MNFTISPTSWSIRSIAKFVLGCSDQLQYSEEKTDQISKWYTIFFGMALNVIHKIWAAVLQFKPSEKLKCNKNIVE